MDKEKDMGNKDVITKLRSNGKRETVLASTSQYQV